MNDTFYPILKKRFDDIYSMEPSDLQSHRLNNVYKFLTGWLKSYPFVVIIPASFLMTIMVYLTVGFLIVKLVTILQFGF